jgi:hypothetical protein
MGLDPLISNVDLTACVQTAKDARGAASVAAGFSV